MARRRKYVIRKGGRKAKNKGGDNTRKTMLNMGRLESFEWNLKKMLDDLPNPENKGAILGSIRNKALNLGIEEAKDYIITKHEEEAFDENKANELLSLLDRYTRRR